MSANSPTFATFDQHGWIPKMQLQCSFEEVKEKIKLQAQGTLENTI